MSRSYKQRLSFQVNCGKAVSYSPYNSADTMRYAGKLYSWAHVSKRG